MKRILSCVLAVLLLLSCTTTALAREPSVYSAADGNTYKLMHNICELWGSLSDLDTYADYYYSDGFFAGDPAAFDIHLANLSLLLANLTDEDSAYCEEFLKSCGFTIQYVNSYFKDGTSARDSVGFLFASKEMTYANGSKTGKTIYLILPRSIGYGSEWCSNITMGTSGDSNGFSTAADTILTELKNGHLDSAKLSAGDYVFWTAGYSRGSSISNMLSRRMIDDSYFNIKASGGNRLYSYNTGVSKLSDPTGKDNSRYTAIHNIVNNNDIVCSVIPPKLGFTRLGSDYVVNRDAKQALNNSALFQNEVNKFGVSCSTAFTPAYFKLDISALDGWADILLPTTKAAALETFALENIKLVGAITKGDDIQFSDIIAPAADIKVTAPEYLEDLGEYVVKWKLANRDAYAAAGLSYQVTLDNVANVSNGVSIQKALSDGLFLATTLSGETLRLLGKCMENIVTELGLDEFDTDNLDTVDDLFTYVSYILNWEKKDTSLFAKETYVTLKKQKVATIKFLWDAAVKCSYTDASGTTWTPKSILGNECYEMVRADIPVLLDLLFSLLSHDYNKDYVSDDPYYKAANPSLLSLKDPKGTILLSTLINNIYSAIDAGDILQSSLIGSHASEAYLMMLRAEDSLYQQTGDIDYDGDVNNDGDITSADIAALSRFIGNSSYPVAADIKADNAIDVADLTALCRYVAHISDTLTE